MLPSNKCIKYLKKNKINNIKIYGKIFRNENIIMIHVFYIEEM
ncbi:Uncharacterised protein [Intestinibacter bartlettii]|uniref:Uncharacterized protein n=1 Tax=Intestinibacter bartlettii TaxID=261299 RepID=A0A6N3FP43_9FIRM